MIQTHNLALWLILVYFTIETIINTVRFIEKDNNKTKAAQTLLAFALRVAIIIFAITELF